MTELSPVPGPGRSTVYTALDFHSLHSTTALMQKVHCLHLALGFGAWGSFPVSPKVTQPLHRWQKYEPRAAPIQNLTDSKLP